jgi:sn-glycerol 3-phosphate transport system ATP-binding protein
MVYVTHDQTEAMGMADQVVLLRDGHIEQDSPPAELYARPATSFCGRFIGTPPMNILSLDETGAASGTDGPVLVAPNGRALLAGIRPEALRLSDHGLPGRVTHAEYMGADTVLACAVGDATVLARLPGRVVLPDGSQVHLASDHDDLHVFDAASGRRVDMALQPA